LTLYNFTLHIVSMRELRYTSKRNVSSSCKSHVVCCPKYRRKVLLEGIAQCLTIIIQEVCQEHQAAKLSMEIMPDRVHLLLECALQFGIHRLVRLLKARSSRFLRQEFPVLKRELPTIWTHAYLVSTAGRAPLSVI
jgi:putative transposase